MQYEQIKITNEYTEIPDELKHKVRFAATDKNDIELLNFQLSTFQLSNKRIALTYEPETVEDQQIIDSYGGLDNTPSYLVRLRPVLMINGERIVVAKDGLPMGADYNLTIEVISPNGMEKISSTQITGNLLAIGITAQNSSTKDSKIHEEDNAETILFKEAMNYIGRWNQAEDELASLLHLAIARPVPAVVTIGGVIDVTYLLDTPHGFEWKGVFVDAALKTVQTVPAVSTVQADERKKTFMKLSALQGSILENRIFEDDFKVESISTAKLFQLATSDPQPATILTIDKTNIDTILPTLPFDENILEDIKNSVNQNLTINIPQPATGNPEPATFSYQDWTGIGYIKENPVTGEAGYMLSGIIAGGMTAVKKQSWIDQDLANTLSSTKKPNKDPEATVRIVRLNKSMADYQSGVTGTELKTPFEVMALDKDNGPVQNVKITFKVIAGGGNFGKDLFGNPILTFEAITQSNGMAEAVLTLGKYTSSSPYYIQETNSGGEKYWELVGLNLVSVFATTNTSGSIYTDKPFEAYGKPGEAVKMLKVTPTSDVIGLPNIVASPVWVKVLDEYDNSISDKKVRFSVTRTMQTTIPYCLDQVHS
ncbi:MAG: hypothetical protein HY758_00580 [Nitrospirae bacterium]|nr:hypothetical protein [Nitrospirota bacterium]